MTKWNKDLELEIIENEIKTKKYQYLDDPNKTLFSIDTPPPYINRPIHIGQATTYAIMDIIARYKRQKGYKVLFPLGLDRNGLPIEMEAEKKYNLEITDPREKYIEKCEELLSEYSLETSNTFKMIGITFNQWQENENIGSVYKTDSEEYRALTQTTFIDLYKKGLIYEDEKITNYCPGCKTTIADSEIEYAEKDSVFYTVLFEVKETGEKIPIATTRPELISSLGMVIYNPEDENWKHLEGKHAISPIFKKEVLIKEHTIAKQGKGTGLVMMCSAGDYSDIRFFIEQKIKPIISIGIDGKMNENAGVYQGLKIKEAREKIIEDLKEENLITDEKKIRHKTPICERSKHEIEFVALDEYYLKQMEYIEDIKNISKEINFINPSTKKILDDWLETISIDWPISRRRYYATEIPIWHCKNCREVILGERNKYQRPWCEKAPVKKCPKCGGEEFIGEKKVLDTWFDSSNTPLYIHKYGSEFFKNNPYCSLRPQGKEIVRTWLYYTLLKGYLLEGKRIFDNVYIHQHILDGKGFKMSKSKGNIIDPQEILKKYGAESFRLWSVSEGNLSHKDFKCSEERISSEQKTLNKLWNIGNFIKNFKINEGFNFDYSQLDLSIKKEINEIVDHVDVQFEKYDFHNALVKIKYFIWNTLSSNYLELVKNRAYNQEEYYTKEEQNAAIETLNYCLKKTLELLYPISPFITKRMLTEIYNFDIDENQFPKKEIYESEINLADIEKINNIVWKYKKEKNLSLKESIDKVKLNTKYKLIEKDLIKTHNFKEIIYVQEMTIDQIEIM